MQEDHNQALSMAHCSARQVFAPGVWCVQWMWAELSQAESDFAILPHLRRDIYQKHKWWRTGRSGL